ncbi:MAG: PEGA domain-containing protein [Blastocatellia bacterium]|nr:PEGA domain-containing protein [Blastocatellia bacterium]
MKNCLFILLGCLFLVCLPVPAWGQKRIPVFMGRTNAPPPKPRVGKGNLAILTTPAGAEVFIDGKSLGRTDENGSMVLEFTPGSPHKVEVKAEDYEGFTTTYKPVSDKTEPIVARLVAKYANLVLAGIPEKSAIFLDGAPPPLDRMVVEGKQITINRVPTGAHTVRIEHPDWMLWEGKTEVKPDAPDGNVVTPPLVLAVVKVTIDSTVGATVYVDDVDRGTVTPDGKLVIPNVRPGMRTVRVVKDDYEDWKNTDTFTVGIEKTIKAELTPIPASAEFNDRFTAGLGKWDAPAGWSAVKGLTVKGEGTGLPHDKVYRDFDVDFDLQLLNGKGAVWVLRTRNGKGYLFYLGGPAGKYKNVFRGYLLENNQFDPEKPVDDQPVLTNLQANIYYHVHIEVRGNKFSQLLIPSSGPDAGKEIPLTFYEDPRNSVRLGNVGFRTLSGEEFQVNAFFIKPQDRK